MKSKEDLFTKPITFKATFAGYTNGDFSQMFLDHLQNSHKNADQVSIPAIINVVDAKHVKTAKKIHAGDNLEVTVKRKIGGYGRDFELVKIKVLANKTPDND